MNSELDRGRGFVLCVSARARVCVREGGVLSSFIMAAIIPTTLRLLERGAFLLKAKRGVHLDILSQPVFSVLGPLSERSQHSQHTSPLGCRATNVVSRGFCLSGCFGRLYLFLCRLFFELCALMT